MATAEEYEKMSTAEKKKEDCAIAIKILNISLIKTGMILSIV
jgi:hypothetical protein